MVADDVLRDELLTCAGLLLLAMLSVLSAARLKPTL